MLDFVIGLIAGFILGVTLLKFTPRPQGNKGTHRKASRKKVDGIWTVREDLPRKPVDPSRSRVRKAVFLERTRRG